MRKAIIMLQSATLIALIAMAIMKGVDALLAVAIMADICSIILNIYVDRRDKNA